MAIPIAREGLREIVIATVALGTLAGGAAMWSVPAVIPPILVWVWVLWFFRDPWRERRVAAHELCAPADGTVTEITELTDAEGIPSASVRIGIFLSLFNVHVNRAPCRGRIRSTVYRKGAFLDARRADAGRQNESNTLIIDPAEPMAGPVVVRQVAGLLARRIICNVRAGDEVRAGERIGLIKFGSRTELIVPQRDKTEILVRVGDQVRAGLTVVARQPMQAGAEGCEGMGKAMQQNANMAVADTPSISATAGPPGAPHSGPGGART